MKTDANNLIYQDLSYQIVGMAMQVHRQLGYGFLEKVYENALAVLLKRAGLHFSQQAPLKVLFEGVVVGDYFADILVEGKIILELKSCEGVMPAHRAQVLNYLKATGMELGYIFNFGKKSLEHERLIHSLSAE